MAGSDLKFPSVPEFYKGKNIFITGATGFMGKILLEKLLRSCPDVGTIYLLLRSKRGQHPNSRIESLINGPVYETLKRETPNVFSKLKVVSGDITEESLGIKDSIKEELCDQVSVVFHCAANVRFDQKLRNAVTYNTLGTKRCLEICRNMKNLVSFVYVSTCYCHCDRDILGEESYDAPNDPNKILQMLEWMDDDLVDALESKLLGNLPNTYAYSKSLSEKLVTDASKYMPVAIARPSIVTGSYREPMPGYVDNLNGPTGLMLGAGKGVLRSMHCKPALYADLIPVDFACNGVIAVAWHLANTRSTDGPLVVNLTNSDHNPISWGEVIDLGRKHLYEIPFSGGVWYPDGSIKNSKLQHDLCVFFFHILPAYLIDALCVLFRQKPFMVNIQKRLQGGLDLLQYYTTKQWHFTADKIVEISDSMTKEDRDNFCTDVTQINWDTYMRDGILGTRKYILKEEPGSLPKAKRHLRRLYWLDRTVRVLFYIFIFWLLYSSYDTATRFLDGTTRVIEQFVKPVITNSVITGVATDELHEGFITS